MAGNAADSGGISGGLEAVCRIAAEFRAVEGGVAPVRSQMAVSPDAPVRLSGVLMMC